MRRITIKQKRVIDIYMDSVDEEVTSAKDLSEKIWDKLVEINDTEILWQEVNNYIEDKLDAGYYNCGKGVWEL